MAYQMLCGRFPFDDWDCPEAPRLSVVWKGILGEEPRFAGKTWAGISEKAQDFCRQLLNK
jgi:calcium-dependent protein kinase